MPEPNSPARVVAIGDPGPTQQQIIDALGNQPDLQLVYLLNDTERIGRELRAAEPDLILIDNQIGGRPTLDLVDDLALGFPEAAIVAILPDSEPGRAQQVTLAGARAFVVQPFTQVNLLSTLRRVRDLEARRTRPVSEATVTKESQNIQPLRTLAVFSPRGGAGCSTLAANLAIALREATGRHVLLMEGKLFFGHLSVLLNLRTHNTLADLIPHANNLDEGLVREVVNRHASGIDVLLSPLDLQFAQGIRAQDLYGVAAALQRMYDFIVIDAGSFLNENTVTLLDLADHILCVTLPELAALHDASRFIQVCRSLAYPTGKVQVLLNRTGIEGGVKAKDVEVALHQPLFASVPDDSADALRSLNRGVPLLLKYPRSPASKSIQALAHKLAHLGEAKADKAAGREPDKSKGKARALAAQKPTA